ncbi:hypothetical protein MJO28_009423 [Puccinia striiformis f. sp. tritici]|uniref:Uncharacterized protein n=3 Tax=Puccinia striiformis TaxID=27350 RepID=A0ACC0E8P4_9BASI|nr:hypothetical protein MJO28_009423 [Puccinia striiformis f. sp. tritici]
MPIENINFQAVIKSCIASVLLQYVATLDSCGTPIPIVPLSNLGQANKYQSHKTKLSPIAIKEFLKMAHQYDLCSDQNESTNAITPAIDIFVKGYNKIWSEFTR